jgi:uncharacterized protein (TIGR02598 family)
MRTRIPARLGRFASQKGLSLIEVTLAIGLVSFAIVPLMGLLAMGFTHYRSATEMNVEAVIVQQVRTLSAGITAAGQVLEETYFDVDGTTTPANDPTAIYKVKSEPATVSKINQTDSITLANRFDIIRIPGGEITSSGVVHVTPR